MNSDAWHPVLLLALAALGAATAPAAGQQADSVPAPGAVQALDVGAFAFEHVLTLPGPPERVWDAITGDLSGWWDHSLSGDPAVFILEPWPGGRFLEQFNDDSRDGVLHATVTVARRPDLLRFEGPLGLTGSAVHGVWSYELAAAGPAGDSTRLTMRGRVVGEMRDGWPETVARVWHHFLFDRLQPYLARDPEPPGGAETTGLR